MLSYKLLNNIIGWAVFIIAATVYTMTVEPTASFWDCGEFIACSYKLQVPHPPGSPLFLLVGRMFSFLAGDDVTQVAYWVNMVSVMASAFSILFLYWTITILTRKLLVKKGEEPTKAQTFSIMASGIIGSLAYTFSDTFWFSAVEAEVYALSSFFTAIVFWAMLKWEMIENDESKANKWLIFIGYLVGLSIGVHLLNLVTLPALALIYYYKKFDTSKITSPGIYWFRILVALVCGLLAVGIIQVGIIPGLPALAGKFEIIFVNSWHMGFGSGIIFFCILFVAVLVAGVIFSIRKGLPNLHTAIMALVFILIGYSSYMIIPIRSAFNPPLDENNPEEIMSFVSYLKREQYGDRPLLYGPTIKAVPVEAETDYDAPKYRQIVKGDSAYYDAYSYGSETYYHDERADNSAIQERFGKVEPMEHHILFPRIYSTQQNHKNSYKRWVDIPEDKVLRGPDGKVTKTLKIKPISQGTNLAYFFRYQINFMFLRYFFWNFGGRAHDHQDAERLYPWETMDKDELPFIMANSKARNQFYMLPFILGMVGVFFGIVKDKKISLVLGVLFLFTGIGIIVFLNQPPVEPRERDYTYAGAFYVFAIWIGLGTAGIAYFLRNLFSNKVIAPALAFVASLIVPYLMAKDGWDDHDRSKRYFSVDSARNLLNSCDKNAIIFTGGDNDTFPLWYVQEVEGERTDVRVCNLSLLNTDWYIKLMQQKAYESDSLPITMQFDEYIQGTNDYLRFLRPQKELPSIKVKDFIALARKHKDPNNPLKMRKAMGDDNLYWPCQTFTFKVNKENVLADGSLPKELEDKIEDNITWKIGKSGLEKKHLIMLDMIQQNNFKRPIYFSTTISSNDYLNLQSYFQLEGLAYRFLPVKNNTTAGRINTDIMYDNLMNNFHWRNMDDSTVFYDENYKRFPANTRDKFYRLASEYYNLSARLNNANSRMEAQKAAAEQAGMTEQADSLSAMIAENKTKSEMNVKKANEVIDECFKVMPDKAIPYDATISSFVDLMIKLDRKDEAFKIIEIMSDRYIKTVHYYADEVEREDLILLYTEPDLRMAMYGLNRFQTMAPSFDGYLSELDQTKDQGAEALVRWEPKGEAQKIKRPDGSTARYHREDMILSQADRRLSARERFELINEVFTHYVTNEQINMVIPLGR